MQGGSLVRNQEHPEDQRLIQVSLPQERSEIRAQRVVVSKDLRRCPEPCSHHVLNHGCYCSAPSERHSCYAAPPTRRGGQQLPQRRHEDCLVQGLDRGEEVGTRGCCSPSGSGVATRRQLRRSREVLAVAPILEGLTCLREEEGWESGGPYSHYASPPCP